MFKSFHDASLVFLHDVFDDGDYIECIKEQGNYGDGECYYQAEYRDGFAFFWRRELSVIKVSQVTQKGSYIQLFCVSYRFGEDIFGGFQEYPYCIVADTANRLVAAFISVCQDKMLAFRDSRAGLVTASDIFY